MDAATILVIVLTAGGLALLVWFEINSRRNEANKKQMSDSARAAKLNLKSLGQTLRRG